MRAELQNELNTLEAGLQEQTSVVLRAIRGVINAVESQDVELCDEVIAFDDEIDQRHRDLEYQVEVVLARQTPVATDLRLVLAVLHASIHLERIGDQCVTVAKLTKLSSHLETSRSLSAGLIDMGERCDEMVRVAADAFANRDIRAARALHGLDDLLDRTNRQVFDDVLSLVHDPEQLEWGMRMISVARALERIGDNAVDVGEQVVFLVTGKLTELNPHE